MANPRVPSENVSVLWLLIPLIAALLIIFIKAISPEGNVSLAEKAGFNEATVLSLAGFAGGVALAIWFGLKGLGEKAERPGRLRRNIARTSPFVSVFLFFLSIPIFFDVSYSIPSSCAQYRSGNVAPGYVLLYRASGEKITEATCKAKDFSEKFSGENAYWKPDYENGSGPSNITFQFQNRRMGFFEISFRAKCGSGEYFYVVINQSRITPEQKEGTSFRCSSIVKNGSEIFQWIKIKSPQYIYQGINRITVWPSKDNPKIHEIPIIERIKVTRVAEKS